MNDSRKRRPIGWIVLLSLVVGTLTGVGSEATTGDVAEAGVFFNDTEFTYKEYWADHSTFTAGCNGSESSGGSFYAEPDDCLKEIELEIGDDVSGAIAAVIYVNLWRNRLSRTARFTVNDGPQFRPPEGSSFSRTNFSATVPLTQLVEGTNSLKFQEATGPYHVHDVMIRVYYDDSNQIIPGPNSDVLPPNGSLLSVQALGGPVLDPTVGGVLNVDDNQVTLTASATGADYVEFHGYYDGYDEDNDGETLDWHNFLRNNFGPGGTEERASGATIGHIGTDSNANQQGEFSVTWNLPEVVNQEDIRFKIRVVDSSGNAREVAGGASADFDLVRSYSVEKYTIPNFPDQAVYFDGVYPQLAALTIDLPSNLADVDRAIILGNYWENPNLSINFTPPFPVFEGPEDTWDTSFREIDPALLRPGSNDLHWTYVAPAFGAMIESPGPMIVIHRQVPSGPPQITVQPQDVLISDGQAANLSVSASGAPVLNYQWMLDGQPITGATSNTYVTPALLRADDGSQYSVTVNNTEGSVSSAVATVNVAAAPQASAPWWDLGWDYRMPFTVFPEGVARNDKIVEKLIDFSSVMAAAGAGGPTFDADSIRVVEIDGNGVVVDAAVPFQFDPGVTYDPVSNAVGTLVWQLTGTTDAGVGRSYHVYFDKTYKNIPAATVAPQITRSPVIDEGFAADRFDMADGSQWIFHSEDGGGFSKIIDNDGNDWISWNTDPGSAGDFRGTPNAVKPPAGFFHPGRKADTNTTIVHEGPLRITFETRAKTNAWISVWEMYPTYSEFAMTRANSRWWYQYEGTPGGEVDPADFIQRSDGLSVAIDGTFESDLPGQEWMYIADPAAEPNSPDGRSYFMAHYQDDGAMESYRLLNGEMPILAFGRGGLNLNVPYLRLFENGEPQRFISGLVDGTEFGPTGDLIRAAYQDVLISVGEGEFNGVNSGAKTDDFSAPTLDPVWTFSDPVGDVTYALTGSNLEIDIPAGPSHDLYAERDFAPRLLQPVGDDDLDVVAAFESTPTQATQGQGLLFWQDSDNWVRVIVDHDGTRARFIVHKLVDGVATRVAKKNLPGVATRFMRVIREGDNWTFERSYNGKRYFHFPESYNIPLDLSQLGIVALAHASNSPAYLASVDYFESKTTGGLNDDAPRITNVNVTNTSRSATVTWDTNVVTDSRLDHGASINLGQVEVEETPKTQHSITVDYLRCGAPYFVRPQSSNPDGSAISELVTFTTDPCQDIVSDDLSSGTLEDHWSLFDPVGDTLLSLSSTNAVVSIPAGNEHNLFTDENLATRLRQEGPVGDFGVEAKFESVLTERFQLQGIVVEEDADSFLRFEVHDDGDGDNSGDVRVYIASVLDNVATTYFYGSVPNTPEHHIRVTRSGNTWTMFHSPDAVTWTEQGSMVIGLDSSYVGPYIGTTSTGKDVPPAFIGSIDYFFNMDDPISPEDGGAGPDVMPPTITGIVAQTETPNDQAVTVDWITDEPATTRVEWGLTSSYNSGQLVINTAQISHTAVVEPVICGQTYHYRVSSNDASGNVGQSPDLTFTTAACPTGAFSDNFDGADLDPRWLVDDPRGDSSYDTPSGLLELSVIAGVRHDLTASNNGAFRVLQPVPDNDFQVMVGFESVVNFRSQLQGLVFEQDDDNLVRFDLFHDGDTTKAFVGTLTSGPAKLTGLANVSVQGAVPGALRVTRTGDNWLFEYSPDRRQTWTTVYSGTITLDVARMGPFAGNAHPQIFNVPEHNALIDYFWSSANPITITEPGSLETPQFTIFGGTGPLWNGEPLEFGGTGLTQPDVNVRGRVSDLDGITSITYQVNGGEPVAMGLGSTDCLEGTSCTRRLARDGDFNADVDASLLTTGLNTITIRAVDTEFNAGTIDVPVNWTPGNSWPLPYSVDWSTVTDLYDVSQPIDGRWELSEDGQTVSVPEVGYDRLLAFGDTSWSSFEAEVPITIHGVDNGGYNDISGGPAIGFIPHWRGHTQVATTQPKYGFTGQVGSLAWYRYRDDINGERFEIRDSDAVLVAEDLSGRTLGLDITYTFKIQAETGGGAGPLYRLKAWEQGTPEPAEWDIVTALPLGAPDTGALVLVAHHVDADFGNLEVREITASAPDITPATGTYTGIAKVEMTTGTRAGEIRYTLDGSEPTIGSPQFTEPFFVNDTTTVRARTFRTGFVTSGTTDRTYSILPPPDRISDNLQAIYRFDEDGGTVARDTSLVGEPLDLVIESGDVTWLTDNNALRVNGPSIIKTVGGATSFNQAAEASGQFTVEMWVDPATFEASQATLFNLAPDVPGQQNFELTQEGRTLDIRLRTSQSGSDGILRNTGSIVPPQLHHVVYVRQPDNNTQVYIDGLLAWESIVSGSMNPWAAGYGLSVANSGEGVNPWTGDIYLLAMYSDALSLGEINTNYQSGPLPPPANFAPIVDAGSDITLVEGEVAQMAAAAFDDGNPIPPGVFTTTWTQTSGPGTAVINDVNSPTSTVTLPTGGDYTFQWVGDDGEKSDVDDMTISVIPAGSQAPAPQTDPPPGTYPGSIDVDITTTIPNAEIRFTVDGSEPTQASPLYAGPLTVSETTTVKARVYRTSLVESQVTTSTYTITPAFRVDDGLLALYDFGLAGGGDTIKDEVGGSGALDLTIGNIGKVTRFDSSVRIDQPTTIQSSNANKINGPIKSAGEVTVELFIDPADLTQSDAMILGMSANRTARNFGFIQESTQLDAYMRTKATNSKGEPPTTAAGQVGPNMVHVVFTRDASGATRIYLDGVEVANGQVGKTLANWIGNHRLSLGGERDGSRSWLGTYYLLAFYDRALTPSEVLQNFAFGDV